MSQHNLQSKREWEDVKEALAVDWNVGNSDSSQSQSGSSSSNSKTAQRVGSKKQEKDIRELRARSKKLKEFGKGTKVSAATAKPYFEGGEKAFGWTKLPNSSLDRMRRLTCPFGPQTGGTCGGSVPPPGNTSFESYFEDPMVVHLEVFHELNAYKIPGVNIRLCRECGEKYVMIWTAHRHKDCTDDVDERKTERVKPK